MLSNAAFNALLKTLEEPPAHVKFIFATTEANKILPTIISRCQRFDLRPIPAEIIAQHLQHIAEEENVALDQSAAWAIARGADGGMRDAQSMLDQLVAFCGESITETNVLDVFGFTSRETVASLLQSLLKKEPANALQVVHEQFETGKDLSQLLGEVVSAIRALVVAKLDENASREGFPEALWNDLIEASTSHPADRLLALIDTFAEAEGRMKWATNKRLHIEIACLKAIERLNEVRISDVIKALDGTDFSGSPTPQPQPESTPASTPQKSPPAEKKTQGIDALIENAPEEAFDPTPEPKPKAPEEPAQEAKKEAPPEEKDDAFYKDPLIQDALRIFKGRLV